MLFIFSLTWRNRRYEKKHQKKKTVFAISIFLSFSISMRANENFLIKTKKHNPTQHRRLLRGLYALCSLALLMLCEDDEMSKKNKKKK